MDFKIYLEPRDYKGAFYLGGKKMYIEYTSNLQFSASKNSFPSNTMISTVNPAVLEEKLFLLADI